MPRTKKETVRKVTAKDGTVVTFTPEEIAELKKKKWSELTYEQKRATLPEKINKIGEWLLSEDKEDDDYFIVTDWEAVMQ
ncbi:MAG: hypothetical protein LUB83_02405 [Prevotellaceae bacterium]|nr:hypothetical protein [Prevotellaceae bacterium]